MTMFTRKLSKRLGAFAGLTLAAAGIGASTLALAGGAGASVNTRPSTWSAPRPSVKANCLRGAGAHVTITSQGPVETMKVWASHLPRNTDFDLFVTQVPNAPFGVSWYQGDLNTDSHGNGHGTFVGRFSIETFAVAPGSASAPSCSTGRFPMPARTRRSTRSRCTTWAYGSTRRRTLLRPAVPTRPRLQR